MTGPLDGLRIVDMTSVLMGPYLTQILGDLGADVVKVEAPSGDTTRQIPPLRNKGMGSVFLQNNRNKRSLVLDLKKPGGLDAMLELLKTADVFVSNVRPKALERLGLTAEVMEKANPRLVTMALVGFGQNGPYAADPAYDDLMQGLTAVPSMLVTAGSGHPHYVPLSFNDRAVGLNAGIQMLAAVIEARTGGRGQHVEVPMFETMVDFVMSDHMGGHAFDPPLGPYGYTRQLNADRRPYKTLDGHICNIVYTDKHWRSFAELIGRPNLLEEDERFASITARTIHASAVYQFIGEQMALRTTEDWLSTLKKADIPVTPLRTLETVADDPHLVEIEFFTTYDHPTEGRLKRMRVPSSWSRSTPGMRRVPPGLGEHSVEVLRESGLDASTIDQLLSSGAVVQAQAPAPEAESAA